MARPALGEAVDLGSVLVTEPMITAWAHAFDPLPFHLDRKAARASLLGDLAASGWQTMALALRLLKESAFGELPLGRLLGVASLKWLRPVLVDTRLTGTATLVGENADRVDVAFDLRNARGEAVLTATARFELLGGQS